jgi:NitT/TauT family transport system ATP-binding protein
MTDHTLIQAKEVTKVYQTKDGWVESLKPLSFSIQAGEFVSVVGPSGCGKSTLLKMVAGLLPITSGTLNLDGQPINGPQKDVGIVFQSAVLLAWRTVFENIMLQAEMRHMPKEEATAKAKQLIEMAGLKGFEGKYPRQLSGGMQQRASICRALLHDPPCC